MDRLSSTRERESKCVAASRRKEGRRRDSASIDLHAIKKKHYGEGRPTDDWPKTSVPTPVNLQHLPSKLARLFPSSLVVRVGEASGEFGDLGFGDGNLSFWRIDAWIWRSLEGRKEGEGRRRRWRVRDGSRLRRTGVLSGGGAEKA